MGLLSSLFKIAAPVVGGFLGGPVGAGIGGALAGASGGGGFSGALKGGALGFGAASLFEAAGGSEGLFGGGGEAVAGGTTAGASSFAPAIANAADPIEAMYAAMQSTGASTATEAAQKLGYGSMQSLLNAVNPEWASTSGLALDASNAVNGASFPDAASPESGGDGFKLGDTSPARFGTEQGGSIFDILRRNAQKLSPLMTGVNAASGVYGLYNAAQARKLGAPGRAASAEMTRLTNNPNAIRALPGYQGGLDAGTQQLNRTLAAQGQTGGGLAAEANARFAGTYDSTFRNAELTRLQNVAQGGIAADVHANDIVRKALEQISYSFRRA